MRDVLKNGFTDDDVPRQRARTPVARMPYFQNNRIIMTGTLEEQNLTAKALSDTGDDSRYHHAKEAHMQQAALAMMVMFEQGAENGVH